MKKKLVAKKISEDFFKQLNTNTEHHFHFLVSSYLNLWQETLKLQIKDHIKH